jgi:Xaa-Pro aminopeptidase
MTAINSAKAKIIEAEEIALELFNEIKNRDLIVAGKTEQEISDEVFELAQEVFDIERHWHKRIVRAGENTLLPYHDNPPNLTIQDDDIVFLDFGPILEDWEADIGRTYVVGNDPYKHKLKQDVELAWLEGNEWFGRQGKLTGAEFFHYVMGLTAKYGWTYGNEMAGHIIGQFPHEKLVPQNYRLYVHKDNHHDMLLSDADGHKLDWILEIHFVDTERKIGGFFEQLLR